MYYITLGVRLRSLRKSHHMTQQQLGDRLGVTKSIISAYENATRYPPLDILIKLAGIFNVSTDYLLGVKSNCTLDVSGLSDKDIELISALINALRKK